MPVTGGADFGWATWYDENVNTSSRFTTVSGCTTWRTCLGMVNMDLGIFVACM